MNASSLPETEHLGARNASSFGMRILLFFLLVPYEFLISSGLQSNYSDLKRNRDASEERCKKHKCRLVCAEACVFVAEGFYTCPFFSFTMRAPRRATQRTYCADFQRGDPIFAPGEAL
jgi:hypothetical protein